MGEEPRDVERRISEDRERMGETMEALTYKANVPARAKGYVSDKKEAVVSKLTGARDTVTQEGESAAGQVQQAASQGYHVVRDNPIGMAVVGLATGFVVGTMLPATRTERERIGPMAGELKNQVGDLAGEAMQHGREVLRDTAETAKESGKEHARELGSSAQDSAQEAAEHARS